MGIGISKSKFKYRGKKPFTKSKKQKRCTVCDEIYHNSAFPHITKNCNHENSICSECVNQHFKITLSGGSWGIATDVSNLLCPSQGCKNALEYNDLKQFLTSHQLEHWEKLKTIATLKKNPEFRWCSKPDCGNGQLVQGGIKENSYFQCVSCATKTCMIHRTQFHEGVTCTEFDQKATDEIRSLATIAATCKPCPACGEAVEKSKGCDHMTCKCGKNYCFSCLADWDLIISKNNSYHKSSCPWYAPPF
jgi:hypothetical protein